jgi:hypothetical protein
MIAEFLGARLDEWEFRGRQALPWQTGSRDIGQPPEHVSWRAGPGSVEFGLRHAATLRAVLALHATVVTPTTQFDPDQGTTGKPPWWLEDACSCTICGQFDASSGGCMTVRLLAADLATHPDYMASWKP